MAHGDVSLERISLESRERRYLAAYGNSPDDALVGFTRGEGPGVAWLVHRSGQMRSVSFNASSSSSQATSS